MKKRKNTKEICQKRSKASFKLLPAKKAAKELNVHPNTIYNWVKRDLIPFKRIGGLIFIKLEEVC